MFKLAKPFFITCETPLHAGSGNDLGVVDLPIQRERHTDFPKIEGSSLKGSIREAFEELEGNLPTKLTSEFPELNNGKEYKKDGIVLAFGPEGTGDSGHAGALGFTDARILLFPVKSMKGVFAYVTCPKVLERLRDDLKLCTDFDFEKIKIKKDDEIEEENIEIPSNSDLTPINGKGFCAVRGNEVKLNDNVILEEYAFEVKKKDDSPIDISPIAQKLKELIGKNEILEKLVILSNDDFKDFVNLSTEVIARTKIDNATGTVVGGALFTEEYLPAETILYSLALTTPIFNENKGIFEKKNGEEEYQKVMNFFENGIPEVIQIGANATIGKGIVSIKVYDKEGDDNANAPSD